ncbi:MAG TPA: type II toxin-antitoxin system VapC family toxin [Spirochaetota bacterium]|jgi:tRNA(fMet)-specific endonuclease VapC|nr:type II toxin-antitoxin system VapC family toxin [Spirochaetota bacterium]HPJ14235.1 type II toxin-antitoxin system VapC family toxin [Spirochaetota bacterium]HPY03009.1 type II toxin-antitoxin system VapC family toxin [Spirochaetota bacterium]HQA51267.1 type II toxin-antitoxin system VapC family toxin [Spirochaetota bacterium]
MKFLIDTNICIYIINKRPSSVLKKLSRYEINDIAISSITVSELEYGINKSTDSEKSRIALIEFLLPFQIVDYDSKAAKEYGIIRAELEKIGQPIGAMDYLIAAHAISLDLILVSNNLKEFSKIDKIRFENWV